MWPKRQRSEPAFRNGDGYMSARIIPNRGQLVLNRRRLLSTAMAMTGAGLVPSAKAAGSVRVIGQDSTPIAWEAPPNVSSAMSQRLAEIGCRNKLRREADLPLLPVTSELKRMKRVEDQEKFSRFAARPGSSYRKVSKRKFKLATNLHGWYGAPKRS